MDHTFNSPIFYKSLPNEDSPNRGHPQRGTGDAPDMS